MNTTSYLLHHKYFKFSIGFIYILLILLKISNPDSLSFLTFTSGVLGFILFPMFMFLWLSVFTHMFEVPEFQYRIKSQQDEITYFVKQIMVCTCIYSFLIGFMMICLSGFWNNFDLILPSLKNLVSYIVIYVFFSSIYITVYVKKKKTNMAIFITTIISLIYGLYMYTSGYFIEVLLDSSFFLKLMGLFVIGIAIMLISFIKNVFFINIINVRYLAFAILLIMQIQMSTNIDFHSYLTNCLIDRYELDSNTLYVFFLWLVPRLIIIMDSLVIFSKYLNENFKYFIIRSNAFGWAKLIWYRILKTTIQYFLIQIIIYMLFTQTLLNFNDALLLVTHYAWTIFVILVLMLIRLLSRKDESSNWAILIYIGICMMVFKLHPSDIWFDVIMIQNYHIYILLPLLFGIAILLITTIGYLNHMKE